jgi:hypothetical protein
VREEWWWSFSSHSRRSTAREFGVLWRVRVSFKRLDPDQSAFIGPEIGGEFGKTSRFGGLPESGERRFCVWSRVNVGIRGFVHLWNGVFDDCIVRDGKFTRGVVGVRVFVHGQRRILFLVREYRAVRDIRRSRGENEFGHFRDSDDDIDVNQSFISENFRRKW